MKATIECDGCGREFDARIGLNATAAGGLCGPCCREHEARGTRALPMRQVASAGAFQFSAEARRARIELDDDFGRPA